MTVDMLRRQASVMLNALLVIAFLVVCVLAALYPTAIALMIMGAVLLSGLPEVRKWVRDLRNRKHS